MFSTLYKILLSIGTLYGTIRQGEIMSQFEKLLERIKNNPKSVRFEELQKILEKYGFISSQPQGGSSHYTFRRSDGKKVTIPKHSPYVKAIYVKLVIDLIGEE